MGIDFINNNSSTSSFSLLKAKQTKSVDSSAYVKGDKQQPTPTPPPPLSLRNVKFLKTLGYRVNRYGSHIKH